MPENRDVISDGEQGWRLEVVLPDADIETLNRLTERNGLSVDRQLGRSILVEHFFQQQVDDGRRILIAPNDSTD